MRGVARRHRASVDCLEEESYDYGRPNSRLAQALAEMAEAQVRIDEAMRHVDDARQRTMQVLERLRVLNERE